MNGRIYFDVSIRFSESVKYAEANLYSRAAKLVGDRNPREHEFSVQLRAYNASKAGQSLGVAALMAMCSEPEISVSRQNAAASSVLNVIRCIRRIAT